jgi:hypothetical protein
LTRNVSCASFERIEAPTITHGDDFAIKEERLTGTRLSLVLVAGLLLVVACGPSAATPQSDTSHGLAPVSDLSPELRRLSPEIQEAYRFALANRDTLEKIPCYCGCGNVGHMDNYMCYVQSESADGQVVFDYHAAG